MTLRCITGGFTIVIATLFLTEHMGKIGFFVWICLIYFFSCGIWAAAPSTLARLFGTSNMSVNYGFVNLAIVSVTLITLVFLTPDLTTFSNSIGVAPITQNTHVRKNSSTQGSSPPCVSKFFPLREVPILIRDATEENHCLIQ